MATDISESLTFYKNPSRAALDRMGDAEVTWQYRAAKNHSDAHSEEIYRREILRRRRSGKQEIQF